jgi:hypothetical protein
MTDSILFDTIARLEARVAALEQWRGDHPSEPPTVGELLTEQALSSAERHSAQHNGGCVAQGRDKSGDEATVEAMDAAYRPVCSVSVYVEKCHLDALRAILAAIKANKIPHLAWHRVSPEATRASWGETLTKECDELREELARLKARKVALPDMIPNVSRDSWALTFSQHGHEMYFKRIRQRVIDAIKAAGIAIEGEEA